MGFDVLAASVSTVGGGATQLAWASQKCFYVHQRATYLVIGRNLPRRENAILARAQVYADSAQFQEAASSFRHAMRTADQTAAEARSLADAFVRKQFERAWSAPTRDEALFEFGVALHTIQDSTSPVHAGFQPWTVPDGFVRRQWDGLGHARHELFNPGEGSALFHATQAAWGWFNQRSLPSGDLFIFGSD